MIRAIAAPHSYGYGVAVCITTQPAEDHHGPARVLHLIREAGSEAAPIVAWDEADPYAGVVPTFVLGDDEARAVLDALTRYFSGAEDTRALRRDYDAERKRVDALTGTLSTLALKLAEPVG